MLQAMAGGMIIADARVFHNDDGTNTMIFPVAFRRREDNDREGNVVRVRLRTASDKVGTILRKGAIVSVLGNPSINTYTPDGGTTRYELEIFTFQSGLDVLRYAPRDDYYADASAQDTEESEEPEKESEDSDGTEAIDPQDYI